MTNEQAKKELEVLFGESVADIGHFLTPWHLRTLLLWHTQANDALRQQTAKADLLEERLSLAPTLDVAFLDYANWREKNRAALQARPEEKPPTKCVYPDFEGGLIRGEHVVGKDGLCGVCGVDPDKERP